MINRKQTLLGLAVAGLMLSGGVQAASVTYSLDQDNAGLPSADYLHVTISEIALGGGDFDFSVVVETQATAFAALNPGSNFGMQDFWFNNDPAVSVSKSNISILDPSSWQVKEAAGGAGSFGKFEFQAKGKGSTRTQRLEFEIRNVANDTLSTYASLGSLGATEFFAAHVGGFSYNGTTSAKFAGSTELAPPAIVPVPAAVWLFGSGLIGLLGLARRR